MKGMKGTGNVGQQSTKVRAQRILCYLFLFLPPPLLFSCPECWLGWAERVPIVLAEEHPRLQASPPPLFTSLCEESRLALIHHPNHVYESTAISRAKQLPYPKKLAMFSKHPLCAFAALDIMRSRNKKKPEFYSVCLQYCQDVNLLEKQLNNDINVQRAT